MHKITTTRCTVEQNIRLPFVWYHERTVLIVPKKLKKKKKDSSWVVVCPRLNSRERGRRLEQSPKALFLRTISKLTRGQREREGEVVQAAQMAALKGIER